MPKNEEKIIAPRSSGIFLVQYMSMAPFTASIIILIAIFTSNTSTNFHDILILLFAFILPLLLITFIMLYFPQKHRTSIVIDREQNTLHKVKKDKILQSFNLDNAKSFISKKIKTNFSWKFNLILEDTENNLHIIFDENTPLGIRKWEVFIEYDM
jgi:hypothetical protein